MRTIFSYATYTTKKFIHTDFPVYIRTNEQEINEMLRPFIQLLNSNILNLDGAVFISDYEIGLRKAIASEFPSSQLFGCWFHFCQAIRRQITTKCTGLASFIRENKMASLQYHKLLSLPLLPPQQIYSSFRSVKCEIEKLDHHLKFASFLEYYERQCYERLNIYKYLQSSNFLN